MFSLLFFGYYERRLSEKFTNVTANTKETKKFEKTKALEEFLRGEKNSQIVQKFATLIYSIYGYKIKAKIK